MKNKFEKGKKAYMQFPVEVKTIDKDAGTLEATFSTQNEDRHGDTVLQEGWDLKMFKKNPVILNSHNHDDAAQVIGKASNVKIENKKLTGKITFAVNENPKAKVIFDLYAGGYLNAFSVGFLVKKFKEEKDGSTDYWTIEEAELLEVSAVSVPANAHALAKKKGIDVDLLKQKKEDDENNDEDDDETQEGDDVEVPKDNEVPADDGETNPGDSDDSDDESGKDDEESGTDTGDESSEDDVPNEDDEEVEEEPKPEEKKVKKVSYASRVVKALNNIKAHKLSSLKRASKIINSLLDNDKVGIKVEKKTKEKIVKRKINQAIRELYKSK